MASLNFPPTTPDVPGPEYTLNGVVYYWDGEKWTANTEEGFTGVFVDVTGDNMTGDLTLGDGTDDKITLGVNGSANFSGPVTTTNSLTVDRDTATEGFTLFAASNNNNTAGKAKFIVRGNEIQFGEDVGVADGSGSKITLTTDGSSTFRGRFRNGSADDNVTVITETGIVQSYRAAASPTVDCFQSFDSNNPGVPTGAWHSDGSIEISGTYQTSPNISLNANGTAAFAGGDFQIYSGGEFKSSVDAPDRNAGALNLAAGSGSNINRFSVRKDGSVYIGTGWGSDAEIAETKLYSDGSGKFAGSVETGTFTATRGDGARTPVLQASSAGNVVIGDSGQIVFANNGSATFAGNVVISGSNPAAAGVNAGCYFQPGGVVQATRASGAFSVWEGYATGNPNPTSTILSNGAATFATVNGASVVLNLEPDNDANYVTTTDVDEEGNTVENRVYNGPTLDVKAVIQDLQQRVNDRDAVIADLTTRIQTLEGGNN